MAESPSPATHGTAKLRALTLGALGVVYGDIGTSPLYTLRECFTQGGFATDPETTLGILSLIFWALVVVVTVKYVVFIMRADNQGEGGILALTALALRGMRPGHRKTKAVMAAGIIGAALFYGDAVITPAISVLSAVEGLSVAAPVFDRFVLPITLTILVLLFVVQRYGTARVGSLFGPVMVVWFLVLAALGLAQIVQEPQVLEALLPTHAVRMLADHGWHGFLLLGAVVLAVTGGEALYADMGHFGRFPIRIAWFGLVLPSLLLCYFGQGALILREPIAIENPFFHLAPDWAQLPLVALATAATVIASQAVISGAFSMTRQAMHLRYLPRMEVRHTSAHEIGQIYLPAINWFLLAGVVLLVIVFQSSTNLAAAYGIAVTGTMVATTALAYKVARRLGRWPLVPAILALAGFLSVDLAFFGANLLKVADGGWFPLLVAAAVFWLMMTWRRGRVVLRERLAESGMPMDLFLDRVKGGSVPRVPGTAVFLTSSARGLPPSLLHNLKHNKVLHERVVLLTVETEDVPYVPAADRFQVTPYTAGFFRVIAHYGFMDEPDIPNALLERRIPGLPFDPMDTTYFVSRETLIPSSRPDLPRWQELVFIALSKLSGSASEYFRIPPGRVVELGMQIEI
ncbi:potassium transporter Kup [Azospirillum rugosum]|uniref:Probable potassium transport system protein Kup n=1 Tax=Azospirillum rugosum TaxID=416170 RepID=A0ABS4SSF7_9PROT|nr:potassium transporter Kup [Azospirillum rugosum]MBP2295494.1 KUP system potassium uptake protein [Azospirillum rugosum]MDQ0528373.1 KUP system potassium uptake protein [Azospirillum rugosum]